MRPGFHAPYLRRYALLVFGRLAAEATQRLGGNRFAVWAHALDTDGCEHFGDWDYDDLWLCADHAAEWGEHPADAPSGAAVLVFFETGGRRLHLWLTRSDVSEIVARHDRGP